MEELSIIIEGSVAGICRGCLIADE